jgi:hypothetical protein
MSHDSARPARNVDRKRVVNHTAIVRHEPAPSDVDEIRTRTPIGKRRAPTDSDASMLRAGAGRWEPQRRVDDWQEKRLTDRELYALFDRLFPHGFAGGDVLVEIASEGWEHSRLLACFHPSAEQLFEERVAIHSNLEEWRRLRRRREGAATLEPRPEPTLDDVRREYEPSPVNQEEEVTELVGLCLWDIFSDNHDVIAADGRLADIGSFRGAGAFPDGYLARDQEGWRDGDYMRFYMGTIWISRRADLMPVYAMIFRRLKAAGADWVYHFPEIGIVELARADDVDKAGAAYSVSRAAVAELEAQKRRAEVEQFRAELREANARAREEAMDRPQPPTVRAYRQVYGRDPRGWPPA